jgi:hypothetical protein
MAEGAVTLPAGFVLDQAAPAATIPQGFVLDQPVASAQNQYDPSAGGSTLQFGPLDTGLPIPQGVNRFLAGAGKGATDLARGTGQALGIVDQQTIKDAEQRDAPLMQTGAGKAGAITGTIAAAAPTAFIPGANTYAGAALVGGAMGAAQPVAEGDVLAGKVKNAAIGGGLGVAGQYVGNTIGAIAKNYAAKKAAQQAATKASPQTAIIGEARKAGYVIPPTQANPSKINRALEGLAGKLTTGQAASGKNQEITNTLVKKALGVPDDVTLTPDVLTSIRKEAGQAYEAMRGAGQITADAQFADDMTKIVSKYQGAGKDFPGLAKNEIADTVEMLSKPGFASDSALDAISILRDKADKAFRGGDKSFGRAYKQMADSMEGVVERNIAAAGDDATALLKDFRDARQLIAKTYSVESAMNKATGNINARKLAQQLAKGKPLSGELKTAARFGLAFPKAADEITSSMPGISPLDYAAAGISSAASGNVGMLGTIMARPLVRSTILSRPYQSVMTNPNVSPTLLQLAAPAASSPANNALLRLSAPSVYAAQK